MFRTLPQLQDWVSCNWLYRYFSDDAQRHLRAKLDEELDELEAELRREVLSPGDTLQEIGDMMWCAIALLINCRMPLGWAVQVSRLQAQVSDEDVAIDLIDQLALTFPHPWEAPTMLLRFGTVLTSDEVCEAIKAGDVDVTVSVIRSLAHYVGKHSWRVRLAMATYPESGWARHEQIWVADSITQLLLSLSVVCQRFGSGLAEVAESTRAKHQDRLGSGSPVTKRPRGRS